MSPRGTFRGRRQVLPAGSFDLVIVGDDPVRSSASPACLVLLLAGPGDPLAASFTLGPEEQRVPSAPARLGHPEPSMPSGA